MSHCISYVFAIVSVAAFTLVGCESEPPKAETPRTHRHDGSEPHHHHDDGHHYHDAAQTDMEIMETELAKLPPEDRDSAKKQHFCSVSGEMLGTMGSPIKVEVNGQQVWVCCESCKEPLLENPEQYLAKLKNP